MSWISDPLSVTSIQPPSGGGGGPPMFFPGVNVTPVFQNFVPGNVSFSNLNNGVPYPAGAVVLIFVFQDQAGPTVFSNPLIGGTVTPSIVSGSQEPGGRMVIFQATMTAPTADTFSVSNGASFSSFGVLGGYFTGLSSSVPSSVAVENYGAQGDPQFLGDGTTPQHIVVPPGGIGVAAVGVNKASPPTGILWTDTTAGAGDAFGFLATKMAIGLTHTLTPGNWMGGSGTGDASGVTNTMNFNAAMVAAAYS